MWLYIVIVIAALILIYGFVVFNNLVKQNNKVKEAFSTMDVYLKKRWDLIPNLVETVKGYAKHESDIFKEVTEIRSNAYDSMSDEQKIKTNEQLTNGISKIMAIAEAYPELKANDNFLNLQNSLTSVEDEIAQSRKYYNAVVRDFNNLVEMVPSNIVAKITGFKTKSMFEVDSNEKENVKVEL